MRKKPEAITEFEDFIKMNEQDVKGWKRVLKYMKEGKMQQARDAARRMDTTPREMIPDETWEFLWTCDCDLRKSE